MKMGKKVREYKSGDFIFAKVKGYPAWPARVQRPNGKKYFVYFYGTGETANLPPNMIFDYAENKDKFLTKTVKRRDFNDGVKQIEYDFANNVPIEQVIGVAVAGTDNDTANDTVNEGDESVADTTAADDTVTDESFANTTQNDTGIEDSDETGGLIIDEIKAKGRKSTAKTPAKETPKAKEVKTPKGKGKKEEADDKEEELVSRSGRKIRPKRYMDEHTEENSTLPSPAPKKRRGVSPTTDKEKDVTKDKSEKILKHFNIMPQSELEELKEPFSSDDSDKENILIAYLPSNQYVGIKLFQSRPTSFKNDAARLQWDKQQASNAITLKLQLERGQITAQSVVTQLIMDLSLTDEEKAMLDKERETEEKKSRLHFLKTEVKMMELDAKIKTCLCLEKADTETCLKHMDELLELNVKPLMLLKHPACLETVKRMRAYVGNTPSWDLSESAAILFSKHAHRIRKMADTIYNNMKKLFTTPEGLSFWEYFSERVLHFKKVTSKLTSEELMEMVYEPIEMSQPTSHTMKSAVESANELEANDEAQKKKQPAAKAKKIASTPSKTPVKRQNSKKQLAEKEEEKPQEDSEKSDKEQKEKENSDSQNSESENTENEVTEKESNNTEKESTEQNEEVAKDKVVEDKNSEEKDTNVDAEMTNDTQLEKESNDAQPDSEGKGEENDSEKEKDSDKKDDKKDSKDKKEKSKDNKEKTKDSPDKSKESKEKPKESEKKVEKRKLSTDNSKDKSKESSPNVEEKANKEKDNDNKDSSKEDEPKAKRTRESKKTDQPPPRSPNKRKSKV